MSSGSVMRQRPSSFWFLTLTIALGSAAGLLVAVQPMWALALAGAAVFVLVWFWRPQYVLAVPALFAVMGDPVFLKLTGAAGQNAVTRVLDAWTAFALVAAVFYAARNRTSRVVLAGAGALGVFGLWGAFLLSQLAGGNALDPEKYWQGEARALLYAGWFMATLAVALAPKARDWLGRLLLAMVLLATAKGLVYWLFGIGIYERTNGYFRLFGSEEATIGLFALAIGVANMSRADLGKNRAIWPAVGVGGVALLVLSSLRAYWGFAVFALLLVVIGSIALGIGRPTRLALGIAAGLAGLVGGLGVLGTQFYSASVATRINSLLSGDLSSDASFLYRLAEVGAVMSAVGRNWLFGAGLGAIQRTALSLFVGDVSLEQTLLRYVHNSFLWAYLKAGVVGVSGVVAYYWGMTAAAAEGMRKSLPPSVSAVCVGAFSALVALIGTDLFNAHISSARYTIIVGMVMAWVVAQVVAAQAGDLV